MNFREVVKTLNEKKGLEFGGPTELFSERIHNMLLYPYINLDGGNILENNHFQASLSNVYKYGDKIGKQLSIDCANEDQIKSIKDKYDFIVTSHVIEHIANPIKAIKAWMDLLNVGGYVLSIIPDYRYCFDHNRPLTTLQHIVCDYYNNTGEDDKTHIEEQKNLHDWAYGGHKEFYKLCEENDKTRVVHHHTFTPETFELLIKECGLTTIMTFKHDDLNIVNLSIKND